jgi:hypothetical protein
LRFPLPQLAAGALAAGLLAAAGAAPASAASNDLTDICTAANTKQLRITSADTGDCATAIRTMKAWRAAGKPKTYKGLRCGEVGPTLIRFDGDFRWFGTWQCAKGATKYVIWTRY